MLATATIPTGYLAYLSAIRITDMRNEEPMELTKMHGIRFHSYMSHGTVLNGLVHVCIRSRSIEHAHMHTYTKTRMNTDEQFKIS